MPCKHGQKNQRLLLVDSILIRCTWQVGQHTWHSLLTWLRFVLVRLFSESLLPLESRSMPFRFLLACFLAA